MRIPAGAGKRQLSFHGLQCFFRRTRRMGFLCGRRNGDSFCIFHGRVLVVLRNGMPALFLRPEDPFAGILFSVLRFGRACRVLGYGKCVGAQRFLYGAYGAFEYRLPFDLSARDPRHHKNRALYCCGESARKKYEAARRVPCGVFSAAIAFCAQKRLSSSRPIHIWQ